MKTNEVTGRFKRGFVGIALEFGRPTRGARFSDIEKVTRKLVQLDVEFETINPTTSLMEDRKQGTFKKDVHNEKVLSAIVEFSLPIGKLPRLFEILREAAGEIDTVFSCDLATRVNPDGSVPTAPYVAEAGLWIAPNGKTNVGLGRPRFQEEPS